MESYCTSAFRAIEVDWKGDIFSCCPEWVNQYSLGNIYKEESFDKIWYSDKAIELRRRILNNDYSLCNRKICWPSMQEKKDNLEEMAPYPEYIKFCHEVTCNYKCITCRDDFCITTPEFSTFLNNQIETKFLPMLKNAKRVCFSGNGDPFAGSHYRLLIKTIAETYPEIKFLLHTNGSMCNEKNCKELGILDKIKTVEISLHATTADTYEKITKTKLFEITMKNVKWISELKKQGKIDILRLSFVVHKLNYKEMPDFVKLAEELDATANFWGYQNWGTKFGQEYQQMAVFEKFHPEFEQFKNLISQDIFKSPNCRFNNEFIEIINSK